MAHEILHGLYYHKDHTTTTRFNLDMFEHNNTGMPVHHTFQCMEKADSYR